MVWGRECRALPKFFSQRKLSLGGNIFFVVRTSFPFLFPPSTKHSKLTPQPTYNQIVFATLLQPQIYLAIKHRIPTVGILLTLGVIGEIITYVARTLQVLDPSNSHYLSIARISPLIAPIFLTFGLYQVLPRLIVVFDGDSPAATKAARWKPRTYTFLFTGWSLLTLVVYAAGLGIQVFATSGASGSVVRLIFYPFTSIVQWYIIGANSSRCSFSIKMHKVSAWQDASCNSFPWLCLWACALNWQ